jgi:hypothetical protein
MDMRNNARAKAVRTNPSRCRREFRLEEDLKTVAQIDAERAQYLIKAVVFTSWDDARFRALKMR